MQPQGRILLADDDRPLRRGVVELLSSLGLEVLEAETGPEAVEIGRLHTIQAALLDLHMPGQTGLEVIPLLQAVHLDLPCIVYSGALTDALENTARRAGAFAVLHKPVEPSLLRSEVLRAIQSGGRNN